LQVSVIERPAKEDKNKVCQTLVEASQVDRVVVLVLSPILVRSFFSLWFHGRTPFLCVFILATLGHAFSPFLDPIHVQD
jgi:hypothetical protein